MPRIIILEPGESEEYFVELLGRLRRPEGALTAIGGLLVAVSGEAFQQQRLGDVAWPERYEGGPEPYVNVAGLVADFADGRKKPKDRRFDRRPALQDTGELQRSVAFDVVGDKMVEAGSSLPYAKKHQEGGTSTQSVTGPTKGRLWGWLKSLSGQMGGKRMVGGVMVDPAKPMKRRLGWLLNKTIHELETKVHRRPFVGVTQEMRSQIVRIVEEYVAEGS